MTASPDVRLAAAGAAIVFAFLLAIVPATPFDYDEADYAYAASQGVVANALDAGAIPVRDFLRLGWESVAGRGGSRGLSAYIRGTGDVGFYRHFHGPLFFYAAAVAGRATGFDERALRAVAAALVALAAGLAAYFASRLAAGAGLARPWLAGLVALAFAASAPLLLETGTTAKPHALFAAVAVAALGAAGMFVVTGRSGWWRAAAVAVGLGVATLEYAPLLAGAVLAALLAPRFGGRRLRLAGEGLALATLTVAVVWPGAVVALSVVKSYVFFAYYAALRAADYGATPLARLWAGRLAESPQLAIAVLVGGAALLAARTRRGLVPLGAYVVALLVVNARNRSTYAPYAASLIPPLAVLFGVGAASLSRGRGAALLGLVALAMPLVTWRLAWPGLAGRLAAGDDLAPVLRAARSGHLAAADDGCVSVPFALVPRLHFYAPSVRVHPYYPDDITGGHDRGPCSRSVVPAGETYVVVSR